MTAASRPALPAPLSAQLAQWRDRWRTLGARERRLALQPPPCWARSWWTVAVQPAWRSLRDARQRAALELQLQQMRLLAAEAQRCATRRR